MAFFILSPLFTSGQAIPRRFTRDGENVSPPLEWHGAPEGTQSFALLLDDGVTGQLHWAAWNILGSRLPEGAGEPGSPLPQAVNDFGRAAYDGPSPPPGETYHPYRFRLAAVNVPSLDIAAGVRAAELWDAVAPHRIEVAELIGIYTRIDPTAQIPG